MAVELSIRHQLQRYFLIITLITQLAYAFFWSYFDHHDPCADLRYRYLEEEYLAEEEAEARAAEAATLALKKKEL